ncbi:MAG: hypothetical protein KDM63_07075, partial [Verrucomicrobiae bacterium]|nr:hypothetical protein [Verrucomicrobiae bacterium]
GQPGQFRVSVAQNVSDDTIVAYAISGNAEVEKDYGTLTGLVTILAGESSAYIELFTIDDILVEPDEEVTLTLVEILSGDTNLAIGDSYSATISILDNDSSTISISTSATTITEGDGRLIFSLSMDKASSTDTVVAVSVSGTTTSEEDFLPITANVTILAGETEALVELTLIDDSIVEDSELVTVVLEEIVESDSDITLGEIFEASAEITDNDTAEVTIAPISNGAEGSFDGLIRVILSNASGTDTQISYTVDGTAINGVDYGALSGHITIPAGETSADIEIAVVDDQIAELSESVSITLSGVAGALEITLGSQDTASISISDNNQSTIVTSATTGVFVDPLGNLVVRDWLGGDTDDAISVKAVTINGTKYLSISDKGSTLGTNIGGALSIRGTEVRVPFSSFTGDIVFDLLGGDDTVTFSGTIGALPGGVIFETGEGFDTIVIKGSATLSADRDFIALSERFVGGSGGQITVSGDGDIIIDNGDGGGLGQYDGITINGGAKFEAIGSGSITLTGIGGGSGPRNAGVEISKGHLSVNTGNISILGVVQAGVDTSGSGVVVSGASTIGRDSQISGAIEISGMSLAGEKSSNGVSITGKSLITAKGSTSVEIQGSSASTVGSNFGVVVSGGSRITTEFGSISVLGGGSGNGSRSGLAITTKSSIESTAGSILLSGTGGIGADKNAGVIVSGGSSVRTADSGNITISGTSWGSNRNNTGVILDKAQLGAESGNIQVFGAGSLSSNSSKNSGVSIKGSLIQTNSSVTIDGISGKGTKDNHGVISTSSEMAASGTLLINGTSITQTGIGFSNNVGIYFSTGTRLSGGFGSLISGTGGQGTSKNHGIFAKSDIVIAGEITPADFVGVAGGGSGSVDRFGTLFVP